MDARLCQTEGSGISGGDFLVLLAASAVIERYKHMVPVL
jgi:hypothetical protein